MKKSHLDVVVLPKKNVWFHRLFRTRTWRMAKVAEKVLNQHREQVRAEFEKACLDIMLYGRAEIFTIH